MNHQLPTTNNFLGLPDELSARDKAEVVLLPLPYEATVSYGRGAVAGPGAIIRKRSRIARKGVGFTSVDLDGLDPSVIMATGTPEPDGLRWAEALDIIRTLARVADIVGFDCVELAPSPGMHASEYTAAKLVYKTMCLIMSGGKT